MACESQTDENPQIAYLTPHEIADLLRVNVNLVYARIRSGELKAIDIGTDRRAQWRVAVDDYQAWLESRIRQPATAEVPEAPAPPRAKPPRRTQGRRK